MLNHEVKTVREDEHTFTLDQDEIAGMVRGIALRALKVAGDDPNVIVGTPNIQVIGGSVAAVLKVVIKVADQSDADTKAPDATPSDPAPVAAEQPANPPSVADAPPVLAPVPAPVGATPDPAPPAAPVLSAPGHVPGFGAKAA